MERGSSTIEFAFDIACPFAYLASLQVEQVAYRCSASITWTPVLLGGLYDLSNAPQGKSGSATDSMPPAKQKIVAQDLQIQVNHVGAPFFKNTRHPLKTVAALRLILSTQKADRPSITHALFRAYWVQNLDISSMEVLEKVAHQFGTPLVSINCEESKRQLHENTVKLASMGAFGVPCFIVNDQLYWGQDRLVLVEKIMSSTAVPRRLLRQAISNEPHTLVFYHDFSSPWSFFASLQVATIAKNTNAKLVYKPFLLGALFRAIGTANVPLLTLTGARAAYARKDLEDWSNYHNAHVKFPTIFPIRSVTALRVAIHDTRVTEAIYNAAWVEDKDISKEAVLYQVLKRAGFDAGMLLQKANEQETKQCLRDLTSEVLNLGACGAPTFLVLDPKGKQ
ncbi:hypothetical protein GOP47_0022457 [Adiantum capillus-veneris]|uniref:DSBA-like thioredoxin domain-containing protein n=1 Tax=Adiantum capillus-veneris TaxID=13818 RepID=A0A9D4U5L3_ADICA|nr:hypothetical protein GOP47_0022457 [Adiantum capillus-veneris]